MKKGNINYKEIIELVSDLESEIVVVTGYCDIINKEFNNLTKDSFWVSLGNCDNKEVYEALSEFDFNSPPIPTESNSFVDGEYQFKAVLRWEPSDYPSYLYVDYMDAQLIRTIQQRDREDKINQTLNLGIFEL